MGSQGSRWGAPGPLECPPAHPSIHRSCLGSPGKAGGQGQTGPLCRSPCLRQGPAQRKGLDQPSGAGRIPGSSLRGPSERPVRGPLCTRALKLSGGWRFAC